MWCRRCRRSDGADHVPVFGVARILLARLALSGCAASVKQCTNPERAPLSESDTVQSAPEGCWFLNDENNPVRIIACRDGRQGLAVGNVSGLSMGVTN
ncbi:hypothetical protein NIG5292_00809 [Nereida ignava]|uniref:Uncharacterized protein n=1 Tax=Nereida ignava TaxID=282199 RepID=A0A0U1NJ67_9RHOB|nr:hypothetical protein NIG5292_00809 [Nereida ignava]SFJ87609.1 hypothetical protein SAMN02745667_02651 [Nereida ignava DSM 16309]